MELFGAYTFCKRKRVIETLLQKRPTCRVRLQPGVECLVALRARTKSAPASSFLSSHHTCGWVMSHTWMNHATHMNESCHTYNDLFHCLIPDDMRMSRVTHMNEPCHTHEWVMSHTKRPLPLPHSRECLVALRAQRARPLPHSRLHITHVDESCHTHEWTMPHT